MQSIEKNQFGQNHRGSLEVNGLPTRVAKVFDMKHFGIKELSRLGHGPFERCKERGVVERPF